MKIRNSQGFTLIEILVVVVIVSILTALGVGMISSGSVERNLQQHGKLLKASIEYACDQATLQNISHGIKFSQTGYGFAQYVNQEWIDLILQQTIIGRELTDGSVLTLKLDGQDVVLKEEINEIPQMVCDSSGQMTPFELIISDATNQHFYQLKTTDFWEIQGQWLDEKDS